jgi:hypothetical protein
VGGEVLSDAAVLMILTPNAPKQTFVPTDLGYQITQIKQLIKKEYQGLQGKEITQLKEEEKRMAFL